jgi:two-component system sensor histidine kinase CiaH
VFTRARLQLTLLYAALLGVTVVLIAGTIALLAVQEAHHTDDRELQLRATAIVSSLPAQLPTVPTGPPAQLSDRDDHGPPRIEERGVLEYLLLVSGNTIYPPPNAALPGLPDLASAQRALQARAQRYATVRVEGSSVRVYNVPVVRSGNVVAIVQVARSQYFVNAAVTRIVLVAVIAGLIGLAISSGAGYWLAGRTLQPIAQALERQRNFVADASHELRTPLTVMLTNAELLTRHPERPLADYQDVVQDMVAEIERLSRLVADLLTLARADQGKAQLALGSVDLGEIAEIVARRFASLGEAKGIAVRTAIEAGVVVVGDRDRLLQLAVILVDNAVRYTAAGGVLIRVAREGREAVLVVSDTGPGIAPEHLPHIFERFYRTDAARSSEDGGVGLGLALADWIVRAHHGHIRVDSEVGKGSTFTVKLPLAGDSPARQKVLAMPETRDA